MVVFKPLPGEIWLENTLANRMLARSILPPEEPVHLACTEDGQTVVVVERRKIEQQVRISER